MECPIEYNGLSDCGGCAAGVVCFYCQTRAGLAPRNYECCRPCAYRRVKGECMDTFFSLQILKSEQELGGLISVGERMSLKKTPWYGLD